MALLWLDGCDTYGTTEDAPDSPSDAFESKYYPANYGAGIQVKDGYNGEGRSIFLDDFNYGDTPVLTTNRTLIVGAHVKYEANLEGSYLFTMRYGGSSAGMGLIAWHTGKLQVVRGTTSIEWLSPFKICRDTWYFVEFKVYTDNSAGTWEVRVNGITVGSGTGVDTQPSAQNHHDAVTLHKGDGSAQIYADNFYVCDGSGSVNNDFLGPIKVQTLRPNGDSTANFTTTTEATHWEAVADAEINRSTYVESNTNGHRELYDYETITLTGDCVGLALNSHIADGSASDSIQHLISSNGTEENSANVVINTSTYKTLVYVSETDPDTGNAWNSATINAAKFGIDLVI
jgi:hypothetical protein